MFTTFSKPGLVDLETNPMFPRCSKPSFRNFGTVVTFTTFVKPEFLKLRAKYIFPTFSKPGFLDFGPEVMFTTFCVRCFYCHHFPPYVGLRSYILCVRCVFVIIFPPMWAFDRLSSASAAFIVIIFLIIT